MTDELPEPGTLFAGRYRVRGLLGSGGFASVLRATQEDVGRDVAIKILHRDDGGAYTAKLRGRFEREARLVAELSSRHVVTLHDFGESDDGLLYMVFELVEGANLEEVLRAGGRMDPGRAFEVAEQVLVALTDAHDHGILHRDVKPANIMLFREGASRDTVKVLDFGVAKVVSEIDGSVARDPTLTSAGGLVGTPRYMSPEQIGGKELTPASDIYSLGLVLWELLAGRPAIDGDSNTGVIREQLSPQELEMPDVRLSRRQRTVLERMLARDPARRFQSTRDALLALRDTQSDERSRVGFVAVAVALCLGVAVVVVPWLTPMEEATVVAREPAPEPIGVPLFELTTDDPGLTFIYVASRFDLEFEGTSRADEIPKPVRAAVIVERDGVPVPAGRRYVGDLSGWSEQAPQFVVREVSEEEWLLRANAVMLGLRHARKISRDLPALALKMALSTGSFGGRTGDAKKGDAPKVDLLVSDVASEVRLAGEVRRVRGFDLRPTAKLATVLQAESEGGRALTEGDFRGVIEKCKTAAESSPPCARMLTAAYFKIGNEIAACRWAVRGQIDPRHYSLPCVNEPPKSR